MYRPDPIQRLPRPVAPRKRSGCSGMGVVAFGVLGIWVLLLAVVPAILGRGPVGPADQVGRGEGLSGVSESAKWQDESGACGLSGGGERRGQSDPLDLLLLDSCGPWGGDIAAHEAAWIVEHFTEDRASVGFGLSADTVERAWTPRALTHVFCGDPTTESLGGMHWTPRWLAMRQHWSLDPSCKQQRVGGVCRVGVSYYDPLTREQRMSGCPKSHAPEVSAAEILRAGLSGMAEDQRVCACPTGKGPVLVVVKDDHEVKTVYPRRAQGDLARCSHCAH